MVSAPNPTADLGEDVGAWAPIQKCSLHLCERGAGHVDDPFIFSVVVASVTPVAVVVVAAVFIVIVVIAYIVATVVYASIVKCDVVYPLGLWVDLSIVLVL